MKNFFILLLVFCCLIFSACATNSEKDDQGLRSPCIGTLIGSNY